MPIRQHVRVRSHCLGLFPAKEDSSLGAQEEDNKHSTFSTCSPGLGVQEEPLSLLEMDVVATFLHPLHY